MFRSLFADRKTTKFDVIMALAAAATAAWKAVDTVKDFKADQAATEQEIEK